MSLVHQVLKDIDQREQQEPVVPQAFILSEPKSTGLSALSGWGAVLTGVAALGIAVAGYVGWNQLATPETESANNKVVKLNYQSIPEIKPQVAFESEALIPVVTEPPELKQITEQIENSGLTETPEVVESQLAEVQIAETQLTETHVSEVAEVPEDKASDTSENEASKLLVKTDSEPEIKAANIKEAIVTVPEVVVAAADKPQAHMQVNRDGHEVRDQYLEVKNAMRFGQWQKAEKINTRLLQRDDLNNDIRNKALSHQLRIYLEQQNFSRFLSFYQQHQNISDLTWLATLAPGLHMAGAYDDAIASYQQLIQLQPEKADWPVAMASALEQNQQAAQALAVLSEVLNRYTLSASQRQWLEQKRADLR
ncbi:tetratricopeptide repeat protein [Bacterioplanoides sp.]|uniref:tetratricopeptide repeat protein n=1 Tax=Bacterioplanoides sp. TaxID=2066072 RepID=UPI003B00477C